MASFFILVLIIWCSVLHSKINDLQNQVNNHLSENKEKEIQQKEENRVLDKQYQEPKPEIKSETIITPATETPKPEKVERAQPTPQPQEPVITNITSISKEEYLRQLISTGSQKTELQTQYVQKTERPAPSIEITAAKLFSWIGGFMLFLAAVFGLVYVLQNDIVSPSILVFLSFAIGAGLAIWGYIWQKEEYRVTSHTLLGSGLAIVYVSIYCAKIFFNLINLETAFVLMAFTAFLSIFTSMKKDAKYVGYLGAIIAFLTPLLINSGKDSWAIFFTYVLCINSAAAYAAVKKSWSDLFKFTLLFTWLCQLFWLFPFHNYKINCIIIFFTIYALASAWLIRKQKAESPLSQAVGVFLCMELLLMLPIGYKMTTLPLALPFLIYVLLVNITVLFLAGKGNIDNSFANWGKGLSFLILFFWLINENLPIWLTLGSCLLFTAVNSGVELLPIFKKETPKKPNTFSLFYPTAIMGALLLINFLGGNISLSNFTSIFVVMSILLVVAIILAVLAEMLAAAMISAIILLFFIGAFIFIGAPVYSCFVFIYSIIPLFLCSGTFFLLRKSGLLKEQGKEENIISLVTSLMPFVLVLTVLLQKTNTNIHWILGTTFVICAINVLVARLYKNTINVPIAVLGAGFLQLCSKELLVNSPHTAFLFSIWSAALLALFAATPYLSRQYLRKTETWVASVLSGVISCLFGCLLVEEYLPSLHTGFVPAIFFMLYTCFLFDVWGKEKQPQSDPQTVAYMSSVVIFFFTLIFPLELHNSWLALAWALEAAFLAYINKILPYKVWKYSSIGLGVISGTWLLFGKILMGSPLSSATNKYLPLYAISAGAFALIASWMKEQQYKTVFYSLCGATLFWILNIEIAYYFSKQEYLKFAFTGNLGEALTYTLAWAVFGLITIGLGLKFSKKALSKTGIWVMVLPLVKFLLSDMWLLELKYRIWGAFILAIILISISFWYQKRQKID